MAKVLVTESHLEDIADSIRAKNGTGNAYKPSEMSGAIDALVVANLGTKTITENGTYNASDDSVNGYSQVTVDVESDLGTKSITANGTYTATDDSLDGYSQVTVNIAGSSGGILTGTTPPDDSSGSEGDIYIQTYTEGVLASDGASCIDTGIIPNARYKVEVEVAVNTQTTNYDTIFGCRKGTYGRFTARFENSTSGALAAQKSTSPSTTYTSYSSSLTKASLLDTYYVLTLKDFYAENEYCKAVFATTDTSSFPYNIYLFNNNSAGTLYASDYGYLNIKYFKVWDENDTLVQYLVPAQDGDDVACMYDLVTGTYFYNIGSGSFTYTDLSTEKNAIYYQKTSDGWEVVAVL